MGLKSEYLHLLIADISVCQKVRVTYAFLAKLFCRQLSLYRGNGLKQDLVVNVGNNVINVGNFSAI